MLSTSKLVSYATLMLVLNLNFEQNQVSAIDLQFSFGDVINWVEDIISEGEEELDKLNEAAQNIGIDLHIPSQLLGNSDDDDENAKGTTLKNEISQDSEKQV